jgi:hypothetical protein
VFGPGKIVLRVSVLVLLSSAICAGVASAQKKRPRAAVQEDAEFGPVVRSYLGYLRSQQEVTDDRVSRHEVDRAYYRRNSNRIRALRQMAIRIARETNNDYLPELEAVAPDELDTLFEQPPQPESLRIGETLDYTFRFLGTVRGGREMFYLFARLDPYEQAELRKKAEARPPSDARSSSSPSTPTGEMTTRPRRVSAP